MCGLDRNDIHLLSFGTWSPKMVLVGRVLPHTGRGIGFFEDWGIFRDFAGRAGVFPMEYNRLLGFQGDAEKSCFVQRIRV